MPTYEYHCEKCGLDFEKIQSMAAKPLSVCPEDICPRERWGRGKVKKKISAGAGLIFKGSGFYVTDYRSEKYKEAAKKDAPKEAGKPEAAASGTKPAGGSDTKPAAKAETKSAKPGKGE